MFQRGLKLKPQERAQKMKKLILIGIAAGVISGCATKPHLDPEKYPNNVLSGVKQFCFISCDDHISFNAQGNSTQVFRTSNGGWAVYSGGFRSGSFGLSK
jgi:hypothetical protein